MVIVVESTGKPRTDFDIVRYKVCDNNGGDGEYVRNLIAVAVNMYKNNLDKLFSDFKNNSKTSSKDFFDEHRPHFAVFFPEDRVWKIYVAVGEEFLDKDFNPPTYVIDDINADGKCLLEVGF